RPPTPPTNGLVPSLTTTRAFTPPAPTASKAAATRPAFIRQPGPTPPGPNPIRRARAASATAPAWCPLMSPGRTMIAPTISRATAIWPRSTLKPAIPSISKPREERMIKFDVTNRFTGAVQFTAEIDCDENAARSVKLGLAVKWGVKARAYLAGANLADAYLADANLAGANLADANLARAY